MKGNVARIARADRIGEGKKLHLPPSPDIKHWKNTAIVFGESMN